MHINNLVILIIFAILSSCSGKKSIRQASDAIVPQKNKAEEATQAGEGDPSQTVTTEEELEESEDTGQETKSEGSPQIIGIALENLVNDQDNELEANTNVATIKAIYLDGPGSDQNVEFKLLETAESDYELFEISGSTVVNKEALIGSKRFVLDISAQEGESRFQTSLIFSISAGELPPESPQNILFQASADIGEDNLVGSFIVVDDERFEHMISFSEAVAEDGKEYDNSLFNIVDDKLYTSEAFAWKESFTIKVEAQNSSYEDLKFTTDLTFSVNEPNEETELVITTIALDPARYPAGIDEYPCNTKVLNAWPTDSATYIFNDDCAVNPWKCALTGVPFDSVTSGLIGKFNGDCSALCIANPNCMVALADISGATCYLHSDMSMWPIQYELYDLPAEPYERFSLTRICR